LVVVLIFAVLLAQEPTLKRITLDETYRGWASPMPVFGLSQVARGLMILPLLLSPLLREKLRQKEYELYLSVLFVLFAISELALHKLL
jgi:hypothetical protein